MPKPKEKSNAKPGKNLKEIIRNPEFVKNGHPKPIGQSCGRPGGAGSRRSELRRRRDRQRAKKRRDKKKGRTRQTKKEPSLLAQQVFAELFQEE